MGRSTTALGERDTLLRKRWSELPAELKTPNQIAGKTIVACGATHHVMEKCNFSCTCCYLGAEANKTEPLPFAEVKEQLEVMRKEFGIGGKAQITAGEVTLLPLEDLGRIIRYAVEIGLDPMVMTHGQRFIDEPEYLISLVRDYGLRKVSIHIDTTQRGRRGISSKMTETDLHAVRDSFATLIRRVRRETGHPLSVASTVTVTDANLADVAGITRWFFRNADAFRLVSFLPVASVGRTRDSQGSVERPGLWEQIHEACGQEINRLPLQFGHRQCNNIVPVLLVNIAADTLVLEGVREGNAADELMLARAIDVVGSQVNFALSWQKNIIPFSRILLRNPRFMFQTLKYAFYRIWSERAKLLRIMRLILSGKSLPRPRPFLFVIHNFMSPAEIQTAEGKARLDACIFKVPVDGELISMCEMNAAGIRAKLDRREIDSRSQPLATAG